MNAKEKAIELLNNYKNINHISLLVLKTSMIHSLCKMYVILCVDEILLNEANKFDNIKSSCKYWEEVKKEIETL